MTSGTEAATLWWAGVLGAGVWLGLALLARWIMQVRVRGEDVWASATVRLFQVYARCVHHLRVEGTEHLLGRTPDAPTASGKPLIIVANHTAGIDPILIQSVLPFEVRWVMGSDMRSESLEWLWTFGRVIFVDREGANGGDRRGVKGWLEAIRHLKSGGALGVFPEGYIERPAQRVLPFLDGVGLLIAKTRAEVLPVVIDGTPRVGSAWGSIWKPSRARLRFLEPMTFDVESEPSEVATMLRQRFLDATGWPANDEPPVMRDGEWWYLDDDGTWQRAAAFGSHTSQTERQQ